MQNHEEATLLPITGEEFDKFADEILALGQLPDNPSYRHAIASCIMHLDPVTDRKERSYFAKAIRKSISNQVAYNKMKQLEKEDQEKQEATTPRTETDAPGPETT